MNLSKIFHKWDERSVNLKKIVCHRSIAQGHFPIYHVYELPRLVEHQKRTDKTTKIL